MRTRCAPIRSRGAPHATSLITTTPVANPLKTLVIAVPMPPSIDLDQASKRPKGYARPPFPNGRERGRQRTDPAGHTQANHVFPPLPVLELATPTPRGGQKPGPANRRGSATTRPVRASPSKARASSSIGSTLRSIAAWPLRGCIPCPESCPRRPPSQPPLLPRRRHPCPTPSRSPSLCRSRPISCPRYSGVTEQLPSIAAPSLERDCRKQGA